MGLRQAQRRVSGRARRPTADDGVLRREQGGVRGLRQHDAARRGDLDRRGVPRGRRALAALRHPDGDRATAAPRGPRPRSGCRISVGVARTKFLAKVASAVSKPDGLLVVPPDEEQAFLHPLPIERLWGVGAQDGGEAPRARASRRSARSRRCQERVLTLAARAARRAITSTRWRTTATRGRCRSVGGGGRSGRSTRSAARRRARRTSTRSWSGSSIGSPTGCAPPTGSAARSSSGCASTTSPARRGRTRSPRRPRRRT